MVAVINDTMIYEIYEFSLTSWAYETLVPYNNRRNFNLFVEILDNLKKSRKLSFLPQDPDALAPPIFCGEKVKK